MISITITGTERVMAALEKMQKINNLVAQWMKSGNPDGIMQKSFLQNFISEGRNPTWDKLADETKRQREYEGYDEGPILQRSGSLMDEITDMQGKVETASGYSRMTWGIEQLSANNQRKFGPNQIGKKASHVKNLPARPMIGFQKQDGKKLVKDLRDWILKSFV